MGLSEGEESEYEFAAKSLCKNCPILHHTGISSTLRSISRSG